MFCHDSRTCLWKKIAYVKKNVKYEVWADVLFAGGANKTYANTNKLLEYLGRRLVAAEKKTITFYRTQVYLGSDIWVRVSLTHWLFLVETLYKLKTLYKCKWLNLVGKVVTNASGAIWWPNLEPMQVALYLDGEITQVIDSLPWVRCASGNV